MLQQLNEANVEPFESTGSCVAYLHRKHGANRVHQEMQTLVEAGTIPRQYVEVIAAELRAARLSKVAEIVESYIDQCPDGLDVAQYCEFTEPPYTDHPNRANIEAWRRRRTRLMAKLNDTRDRWLRLAGIETE
jgi:hypothetical protein